MPTMSFLPELTSFLKENGTIYTVRKYKMSDATVGIYGIGDCHRIPLGGINSMVDLIPYVGESGFLTIQDWWNKITHLFQISQTPNIFIRWK